MNDTQAIEMLAALAQETRFNIFRLLMRKGEQGLSAGEIAKELDVLQNTLSSHLKILTQAGIVESTRNGRHLIYAVRLEETRDFIGHLVNDCCDGHPEVCAIAVPSGTC